MTSVKPVFIGVFRTDCKIGSRTVIELETGLQDFRPRGE